MKTNRLIALALLAAMTVSCGKEGDGRLRLVAEPMTAGGAKLLVDPANPSGAQWVAGEQIDLCGDKYTIADDGDGGFCINTDGAAMPATLYAVYPATVTAGGNDIAVSNGGASHCAVAIGKLCVNRLTAGGTEVLFPMAARADATSGSLLFKHLTGGVTITLNNTTGSAVSVDTVIVGATNAAGAAIYRNLHPNGTDWPGWNPSALPAVPGGTVGEETGDAGAKHVGTMTLVMRTDGTSGVTIPASGSFTFCLPMLADSVRTLTVTGKSGSATLFERSKNLAGAPAIERNIMYQIPAINL